MWQYARKSYPVFLLFFVLIYKPSLAVIAVSQLVGADKLNMSKVFSPLGNNACDFCWTKHVNLKNTERKSERIEWESSYVSKRI